MSRCKHKGQIKAPPANSRPADAKAVALVGPQAASIAEEVALPCTVEPQSPATGIGL